MAPINSADLLKKTDREVRVLVHAGTRGREYRLPDPDLMPRSLALTFVVGSLMGATFWAAIAVLILN